MNTDEGGGMFGSCLTLGCDVSSKRLIELHQTERKVSVFSEKTKKSGKKT